MPQSNSFDLIVIGAGPGGYVAAIRAAQLGMKTACVERQYLGGTCLNVGCIPSKALLESSEHFHQAKHSLSRHGINIIGEIQLDLPKMIARKQEVVKQNTTGVGFLFKKNNITHLVGNGRIASAGSVEVTAASGEKTTYSAKNILIATGSAPSQVPSLPFDGQYILSSTEALALTELPKRLVIVGGGYIGVEMGSVFSRLGSDVLTLEFLDRILPASDKEMAMALQRSLEKQGFKFRFKTMAQSAKVENNRVKIGFKSLDGDQTGEEEVDKVLVCVGRKPITDNLGLAEIGIGIDPKGFVKVNERFETSVQGIYAIGDVIGGIMLAHKAEEEGMAAVELMAGKAGHVNYHTCPSVVYTMPQLAQVGLTQEDAEKRGAIRVGKYPFVANGYARAMDFTEGSVKVIADAQTDRILGVHILGPHAAEMIHEAVVAMEFAGSAEDLARSFHAHPTLNEAVKEAALNVEKRSIHIPN
jgi:dihydrolipoamide dehydrogenase